ncbi:MAG: DUF1460 domain-containing protein [Odoribacteraceae bacterium]|jgi:hypothetical protein|nr:DUF1460 domain-containing protein [Odoribacteraceae bacterium]
MKTPLAILFALLSLQCSGEDAPRVSPGDRAALERYLAHAREHRFAALPLARRVAETGRFFLGLPYRGGTLDGEGPERLVVNLREVDCVTFVDNVLALALLASYDEESLPRFLENLRRVRYRDGKILDYTSRLHYSTDWLFEMQRQGILRDCTPGEGSVPFTNRVNYLSRHYLSRAPLAADPALVARVVAIEEKINAREKRHLPKERVESRAGHLQEGDIVLITTGREGLDTAHLGIAVEQEGKIFLLHASSDARAVVISRVPLRDYLQAVRHHAGIIVARTIQ